MEETMEALHDMTQFVAMQDLYNLVYREEEREMIPYHAYEGIGQASYSPLEKGKLARPLDEDTLRSTVDSSKYWSRSLSDTDKEIIQRAQKIAEHKPTLIFPIVDIGKKAHLKGAIAAVLLKLTEKEIRQLEEPYVLNL
ncbi:hypothetical protein G6F70_005210 [Rhizopus microsporus]|nr:hypothetical protein G6F71_002979 [Rhizopus microsporus]KAG1199131.1 hypothetical protein G6F70_005210 [Rhizopus microsporus]KAG1210958.1 hypothetical protein G6F69_005029 [Rhizopus microsporus]KAG1232797.1 hypothetical protein G6F67_004762 [Rhizopus microsporus]KAG1259126.1 hypothetical protein G6F68_008326 [Rhizopus microsporus]